MFLSLYDKNFRTINNNSSLIVESYNLKKRAYDLNEFNAICESVSLSAEPMFAMMKTKEGDNYYDLLSPLIIRNENNKSKVVGRDLYAVFNTECIIDFTVKQLSVNALIQFIYNSWKAFDSSGFNTNLDLSQINIIDTVYQPSEKSVYNVKDLLTKTMKNYGLFLSSKINLQSKTLDFVIRSQKEITKKIRLEDFNITDFNKYQPETNTAIAMNSDLSIRHNWYLKQDNSITTQSALRDIFPTATKIFTADDINQADFEAVSELGENRFQEEIPINIVYDYNRLSLVDFNTSFEVYYQDKFYKVLPVGEIIDNGTKNKILKLGNLPVEFIQLI